MKYAMDIPEGSDTTGYKIFYKLRDQLYSAFYPAPDYVDRHADEIKPFETRVPLLPDDPERGYYYWCDKDVAHAYLLALQRKMRNTPLQGSFVVYPVSGTAMKRGNDEGDRMTNMIIDDSEEIQFVK